MRHLKEGMSRVELVPLHLPIPELSTHPRMTRAQVMVSDIDLLQLSAAVRVLEIEAKEGVPEKVEEEASQETPTKPEEDVGAD